MTTTCAPCVVLLNRIRLVHDVLLDDAKEGLHDGLLEFVERSIFLDSAQASDLEQM